MGNITHVIQAPVNGHRVNTFCTVTETSYKTFRRVRIGVIRSPSSTQKATSFTKAIMSDSRQPKTVFITATSSGIGLATATLFHSLGWNVVATMRTPSSAPSSLSSLEREREGSLLITRLDYQDLESIEDAVKQATERFGRLDVVVCGGGYGQQGVFEAISREKVKAQFDVNLFGRSKLSANRPHHV